MGVGDAPVLLVGLVYGEVHHHAPADKLLQQKLPCKGDVFFQRKLVLQGNIKAVRKLGVLAALGGFQRVPQGLPVLVFGRGLRGQENIGADHAALAGVVAVLAVAFTVKPLPGAVGGGRDGRLSGAALHLRDRQMKQGHLLALPLGGGLDSGPHLRHGENLLGKGIEALLGQGLDLWGHALHGGPSGD